MGDISKTTMSGIVTNLRPIKGTYGDGLGFILEQTFTGNGKYPDKLQREEIIAWGEHTSKLDGLKDGMPILILDAQLSRREDSPGVWKTYLKVNFATEIALKAGQNQRSVIRPDVDVTPPLPPQPQTVVVPPKMAAPKPPRIAVLPRPTTEPPRPAAPSSAASSATSTVDVNALVNRMRTARATKSNNEPDF